MIMILTVTWISEAPIDREMVIKNVGHADSSKVKGAWIGAY